NWGGEAKEGQSQIHETVLVWIKRSLKALSKFIELEENETRNQSGGGGNCRDNSASDQLALVTISGSNFVVFGTKIGGCHDEVDVIIGVIVLLKFNWTHLDPSEVLKFGKFGLQLLEILVQVVTV